MNEQTMQWNDLRTILAIAQAGSLSGAGRKLHVSHATVFRRLGDIEHRLGVKLFNRTCTGYTPTPAGEEVAALAERIEADVLNIERRIIGQDVRPAGTVRITTTDTLLMGLLSPIFVAFRQAHPEISLEVVVSNQLFDLSRREADVAIRPSLAPPETLVGRKIGVLDQAIYCRAETESSLEDELNYTAFDWIGPDENMAYRPLEAWMAAQGVNKHCRYRVDTLMGMLAAVRDGMGVAVLPCYLGDDDPRLVRIGKVLPELATDLWLLTHPDLRSVARIRVLLEFVTQSVRNSPLLDSAHRQ